MSIETHGEPDSSDFGKEESGLRLAVSPALEHAIWARSKIHRVQVPKPSLQKRLVGSSYALAIDLYSSMCSLAAVDGRSGVHVLARSVVESYARGFWLAHIVDAGRINEFAAGKLKRTLKPLLRDIRASKFRSMSGLGVDDEHAKLLDSLTHGDIEHLLRRNLYGSEIGSHSSYLPCFALLILGASIANLCVEAFVRDVLDDESRASVIAGEGARFIQRIGLEATPT